MSLAAYRQPVMMLASLLGIAVLLSACHVGYAHVGYYDGYPGYYYGQPHYYGPYYGHHHYRPYGYWR